VASNYYKLVGSKNPTVDWTAEVILEKDDEGNVTKSVGFDKPAQLNEDDRNTLESLGYEVESSSKEEAEEAEEREVLAPAALGTAPLIGSGTSQPSSSESNDSDTKKS
jgi:hypothetical protein